MSNSSNLQDSIYNYFYYMYNHSPSTHLEAINMTSEGSKSSLPCTLCLFSSVFTISHSILNMNQMDRRQISATSMNNTMWDGGSAAKRGSRLAAHENLSNKLRTEIVR